MSNLQSGMFGNVQNPETLLRYWQMQERAHYPHAREMVEYMQEEVKRYKQNAVQQGVPQTPARPVQGKAIEGGARV